MGQPRGYAFWERVVAEVERGTSQAEAARRHAVSQAQLSRWVRRLHDERAQPPVPALLPVRVVGSVAPSRCCRVVLDGLGFEFEEGTDPAYVAAVARALRAC